MKLIFMGTPGFAVPSLECLIASNHKVLAVVTAPDKPQGRGLKVQFSPVKKVAVNYKLPVLQPQDLRHADFYSELRKYQAGLFVVVAFRILPVEVFEMPPDGTINLHSSLLPKYRGAAPINWAVINGEKETGVSTIFIQQTVDTGDLIFQERLVIRENETAGELYDRLSELGAKLLLKTIDAIENGSANPQKQRGHASKAPKLTRELAKINWRCSSVDIRNLVRGLNPFPGAFTTLGRKTIKIFKAEPDKSPKATKKEPGKIIHLDKKAGCIAVETGDGSIAITELQPEGKRRMTAHDFLLGYPVKVGDKFGID